MIVPLIAFAVCQRPQSLLQQIVPNPTGRNGYEDYLRAADLVRSMKIGPYERWIFAMASGATGSIPKEDIPPRVTPAMSVLDVRRRMDEQVGPIIAAIKEGNAKEVYDPRSKLDPMTMFPEFAQLKVVARIVANRAHVEFAAGRSNGGTTSLLDGLTFAWNLQGATIIASLVSIACSAIELAEFQEHLGQLTPGDAATIERFCNDLLARPLPIESTFRAERELMTSTLAMIEKSEDLRVLFSVDDESKRQNQVAVLKNLGKSDLRRVIEGATPLVAQRLASIAARLTGPESGWFAPRPPTKPTNPRDLSVENLAHMLADICCDEDPFPQYATALAKARLQLRLLRVHAQIIRYRWNTGALPANLDQCCSTDSRIDPFTREPLHFEPIEGGYRLYSLGVPDVGKVELKYKSNGAGAKGAEPPSGDPR